MMKSLGLFVVIFASVTCKSLYENEEVLFLPDPAADGDLIEARLSPTPDFTLGSPDDVHFYLYTRENPLEYAELFVDDIESVNNSAFDPDAPVKILIHGFGGAYDHSFPWNLRREYVKEEMPEKMNVILLEWSILSANPDYFGAVANAQIASSTAANFLNFLVNEGKTTWEKVHLVGFSLGGQVVGQIGYKVQQLGGMVDRITALDPALPLFDVAAPENRTTKDDALFVDVIHTAANGFLAFYDPMGHIDFYPNGGRYQPGCGIDLTGSCAHSRAPAIFIESVFSDPKFYGLECESYENFQIGACKDRKVVELGHFTPNDSEGTYFLKTEPTSPFVQPLPRLAILMNG